MSDFNFNKKAIKNATAKADSAIVAIIKKAAIKEYSGDLF